MKLNIDKKFYNDLNYLIDDELIKNHYTYDIKINYTFEDIITIFNT